MRHTKHHDLKDDALLLRIQLLTLKRRNRMDMLKGDQSAKAFVAKRDRHVALLRGHGLKRF